MIIRELLTKWKIIVDNKTLNKLQRQIRQVKKDFDKAGKAALKFGKKLTTFVTLPLALLGVGLIKAASDAEEAASKFNTVFRDMSSESQKAAKDLSRNFGLSRTAAKELLGDTGDLLTGFGFTQESALDLSTQVQKLAVDLASFTNFTGGAKGASAALTKALLGERESVKSLGISILEEDVKRKVALNTAQGMTFATKRQAKAFATLQLAQDQSKNAIGDFARTSGAFANRFRTLTSRVRDAAESFGVLLLPAATEIVNVIEKLVVFLDDLSPSVKATILVVGGLAAAIGPLLLVLGILSKASVLVAAGFTLAKNAVLRFQLSILATVLLVAAAIAVAFLIIEDLFAFFDDRPSVTGKIVEFIKQAMVDIVVLWKQMVKDVSEHLDMLIAEAKLGFFGIVDIIARAWETLVAFISDKVDAVGTAIGDAIGNAMDIASDAFSSFGVVARTILTELLRPIRAVVNAARSIGRVFDVFRGGSVSEALAGIKSDIIDTFDPRVAKDLGTALGFNPDKNTFEVPGLDMEEARRIDRDRAQRIPIGIRRPDTMVPVSEMAGMQLTPQISAAPMAPALASQGAGGGVTNITISPSIVVPPGTPPELAERAIRDAAKEVFSGEMRNARRTLQSGVAF